MGHPVSIAILFGFSIAILSQPTHLIRLS